ncbi:MAG: DUF421 domain-containing protein [Gemmatimonadetes bacterium]|nr:DUF421 domain-containing protein [Gemmatimonadota bacterium]
MDTVVRVVLIYLFLLVTLRVIGKREFGQLAPFEVVMLLLISEIVQQALVREDFSLTNALIGTSTLLALVLITSVLSHLSARVEAVTEGSPTVLVRRGALVEPSLNRERVTPDELLSALRKFGVERLEDVEWAILETDGQISVVPRRPAEKQVKPKKPRIV